MREIVNASDNIFICDQCFNSLKSIAVSQAKCEKIINIFKNSVSDEFKSSTATFLDFETQPGEPSSSITFKNVEEFYTETPKSSPSKFKTEITKKRTINQLTTEFYLSVDVY